MSSCLLFLGTNDVTRGSGSSRLHFRPNWEDLRGRRVAMEGKRAERQGKRVERLGMKAVQQGKLVAMEGMKAVKQGTAALEKASEHLDSQ